MSRGKFTKTIKPDLGPAHCLSPERAAELAAEAWRLTFVPAFWSTPHPDDDSFGDSKREGQRKHLQLLCAAFGLLVARHAVAAGLYGSEAEFMRWGDEASDPALAGVARAGGAS